MKMINMIMMNENNDDHDTENDTGVITMLRRKIVNHDNNIKNYKNNSITNGKCYLCSVVFVFTDHIKVETLKHSLQVDEILLSTSA